jgi:hypothetical protein
MPYLVIVLATLTRFIPHLPNFSPVYGALLFGGANLKRRDSLWFSALTLGASDIVLTKFIYHLNIGWGELIQMAAFVSIAMIGWVLQKRFSIGRLAFACLAAPTAFYMISDFGVWLGYGSYPHTWAGLVACYVAAIPYQGRITASTVLFSAILFGGQQIYVARVAQRKHSQALAR